MPWCLRRGSACHCESETSCHTTARPLRPHHSPTAGLRRAAPTLPRTPEALALMEQLNKNCRSVLWAGAMPSRPAATRERILDGAARALARHGLAKLGMQDVSQQAAVSRGTLYRYFPNRDDLLTTLARHE